MERTNSLQRSILIFVVAVALSAGVARAQYTLTTLASFNGPYGDGFGPAAGLTLSGNTLYGTTVAGGANNDGTVFSVPITGGTPTVLVSFNGTNGNWPSGGLTLSGDGSTLYGTTAWGGANGDGTVFSVPITGGTPAVLASFNGATGEAPRASLTLSGNTLYGTTGYGGANGDGTVFSVPITGGTPTVLASFNVTDGYYPDAGLTLSGNTLYGTTESGGASYIGVVFSVPVTGGTPTVLASFNSANGKFPDAGLTLSGSSLYGTTEEGGANGDGTVFSVPITGGTPTVLASFNGTEGSYPEAGLTLSAGGDTFYGTTVRGGTNDYGTVFSVPITGGTPTVLASFNGTSGVEPYASLTLSGSTLYGTTYSSGGANNYGTVFALRPNAVSLSSSTPTAYGSQVGMLTITRVNGVYSVTTTTFAATPTGYLAVSGVNPSTDPRVYALHVTDSLPANLGADLVEAITEIDGDSYSGFNLNASTTDPTGNFGDGFNFYVTVTGSTLGTGSPYFGFDFTQLTGITDTLSVDAAAVTAVPEPATSSLLLVASAGILLRRWRLHPIRSRPPRCGRSASGIVTVPSAF